MFSTSLISRLSGQQMPVIGMGCAWQSLFSTMPTTLAHSIKQNDRNYERTIKTPGVGKM